MSMETLRRPKGGFQDPLTLRKLVDSYEEEIRFLKRQVGHYKMMGKNWKRIAEARKS